MLRFYGTVLANEDVRIESSTDAIHGVEWVETLNPDSILPDLTMPGTDGMEALRLIRLRYPEARVVMITGDYSIESAIQAIKAGATDYVCKPISAERVRQIVQETRGPPSPEELRNRRGMVTTVSDRIRWTSSRCTIVLR